MESLLSVSAWGEVSAEILACNWDSVRGTASWLFAADLVAGEEARECGGIGARVDCAGVETLCPGLGNGWGCGHAVWGHTASRGSRQGCRRSQGIWSWEAEGAGGRIRITIMSKIRRGREREACDGGGWLLGFWKSLDVWATNSRLLEL